MCWKGNAQRKLMKGRFDSVRSNEDYWFVYSHRELYWCCLWPFPKLTASTCSVYYFTFSLLLPQHETEKNYAYQVLLLRSRSVVVPRFSNDKVFEDKWFDEEFSCWAKLWMLQFIPCTTSVQHTVRKQHHHFQPIDLGVHGKMVRLQAEIME